MSSYLEFKNKGEVPVNAFKLLGASTKRGDDTKIGFFGTGLKYAIAVLLREGVDFKVFIGKKELKVGTRKTDFSGNKIDVLTINNEKTSITLDAGVNWEPWFAIREIYSNTIDEDGGMELVDNFKPEDGHTTIYIEVDGKLGDVSRNWQDYFSMNRQALFFTNGYRILSKRQPDKGITVFRKGIRAYHSSRKKSLFDYDVGVLKINESRVAELSWEPRQRCAEALALCTNETVIRKYINSVGNADEFFEHDPDFWNYIFDGSGGFFNGKFSDAWYNILKDKRIVPLSQSGFYGITNNTVVLSDKLIKQLHKHFGDKLNLIGTTDEKYIITGPYREDLDESMDLISRYGFSYPKEMIKVAKFKDENILGACKDKKVILSEELFTPAYNSEMTAVLLEEVMHAKSGMSDYSREFQDYMLSTIVGLMKDDKKVYNKV